MTQLVKINAKDYGLEESKAKQISDMFKPMLDKMVELEKEYNEIAKNEISPEICIEAKVLRLKYVKVRTGTAEIHRELKHFYLQGGRFVDGWKNAQLMASEGVETKLMSIENHYENLKKERIAKLQEQRVKELEKYGVDYTPGNLGEMGSEVWNNYLPGVKLNHEAKIKAEKKAEEERIENIRLDKRELDRRSSVLPYRDYWGGIIDAGTLRDLSDEVFEGAFEKIVTAKKADEAKQERVRKDNLRLQKEADERERRRIAEKKKRDEQAEKERKIHEAELKKIQDEKNRIAEKLEANRIAEEKAEKERLAKIEADKKKGDKDKMIDLVAYLEKVRYYEFESESFRELHTDLIRLINGWIPTIK